MHIYHFSDIHEGALPDCPLGFFSKRIIGSLNFLLRRRKQVNREFLQRAIERIRLDKPEVVVISGDFSSIGSKREFARARKALQPLKEIEGIQILAVPGNHDNYAHCKKSNKAMRNFFLWLCGPQALDFPRKLTVAGAEFYLLDHSKPNILRESSGLHSDEDNEKLVELLAENSTLPRIVVGHYPTLDGEGQPLASHRCLIHAEKLRLAMARGAVSAYLCGHVHYPFLRKDEQGLLEVCAGSLTMGGLMASLSFDKQGLPQHQWINLR